MKTHISLILCIFCISLCLVQAALWGNNNNKYNYNDRVLMSDVKAITLRRGEMTTGRRSKGVAQLACVGGAAASQAYEVDTVQCRNVGFDGRDAQWKCESDLDSGIRFGKVEVICEGFDYPDDPYILRGSCGLEYTLEYTNQGRQKQQQQQQHHQYNSHHNYNYDSTSHKSSGGFGLKTILMLGIVGFIFYNVYKQCIQMGSNNANNAGGYPGGGAGAGGYPGGGYGPGGFPPGPGGYPGGSPYYGSGCNVPPPAPAQSWRPGFWTGLATGGFMGNFFRPRNNYGTRYASAPASYSSGSSFGGSSSFSSGSSTRTSSGYGGTRRR